MGWLDMLITRSTKKSDDSVDPDEVALRATLADLRRVSSDIHETNAALSQRLTKLKGSRA